jgi:hypothetical protein
MTELSCTICTLGFANIPTMVRTFDMVLKLKTTPNWFILDNHYSEESSLWLKCNAEKYGYKLFDNGYNMGLHDGFNYLMQYVPTSHVLGLDPDTLPMTAGFDSELMKHAADLRNVWVSCFNTHSFSEMRKPITEGQLIIPAHPVVNSICLWQCDWLRGVGGVQEPTKLYGGLECCMWKYVDQKTKRWVFALNSLEACSNTVTDLSDPVYKAFKWAHAHVGDKRSWEEFYLAEKK